MRNCDLLSLEEFRGRRSLLKREIRRVNKGHEIALADKVKMNPKIIHVS